MIFREMDIQGLLSIKLEPHPDERGFFTRTYCEEEFGAQGLNTRWPQSNFSHSNLRGTLRGIHFQLPPATEIKLVRVLRGALFAVVVDLRDDGNFGKWQSRTLSANDLEMLYVPAGCGFSFQTLEDHTEVAYQMSAFYSAELSAGVCWDDPDLAIPWPLEVASISERDRALPLLRELAALPA